MFGIKIIKERDYKALIVQKDLFEAKWHEFERAYNTAKANKERLKRDVDRLREAIQWYRCRHIDRQNVGEDDATYAERLCLVSFKCNACPFESNNCRKLIYKDATICTIEKGGK